MKYDTPLDKNGNKRKKVALVGFSESSRHLAPYDDDSWEVWGVNQLYRHIPRATRWWEIHKYPEYLKDQVPGTNYMAWLKDCPIPIYMTEKRADIPNAIAYPIEEMVAKFGDYFYSTISYMIALAIHEEFDTIGIWGIDLSHDSEYEYQKPSAEYFLGVARGLGIDLMISSQSALLKGVYRYGYQELPSNEDVQWLTVYKDRVAAKQQEVVGMVNMLGGQIACADEFLSWARAKRRGSAPPPAGLPDPDKIAKNT